MKQLSIRSFIVLIAIFSVTILKAQTENTSERLIDQLKKGTVPGWRFARNVPVAAPVNTNNTEQKESLITQIRKGTAPGMKFMPAGASAMRTNSSPATMRAQSGPLASEQEIKKETLKTIAAPPVIPHQEEAKKEAPAGKQ
jgi:hypothetical protein